MKHIKTFENFDWDSKDIKDINKQILNTEAALGKCEKGSDEFERLTTKLGKLKKEKENFEK